MLTPEQLAERRNYIGGSEAAAALGLSRWTSPLKLWALKTGQIPEDDLSDNQAVEMGNELEETVCRIFTKRTGKKVARVNETLIHPSYDFIRANIDRRVVGEDSILEAKTCSAWRAREFEGEELPAEYILQVMHYLAVTNKNVAYIAVLIGGQDFRWKAITRDDKIIADMLRREVHFWREFVEKKIMPTTIKKEDADTLYQLFPVSEDKEIELDDEANIALDTLEAYKADRKVLDGNIDRIENEVKVMLKDAAIGKTDRWKVSWKSQVQKRLDSAKLKETKPEIFEQFVKNVGSRVFRTSVLEG